MEVLIGGEVCDFDAEQIFDRACDIVALAHAGRPRHDGLKALGMFFKLAREANRDKDGESRARGRAVYDSAVAFDDAAAFEFLNAAQTGRGREADSGGEVYIADAAIAFEDGQYSGVYIVNFNHLLQDSLFFVA